VLAVIRIRGKVNVNKKIEDTLKMLRLNNVNNCVIVPEEPTYLGMIEKCKDYIAYGNIKYETFFEMLKKRGRLIGDKRLNEENVKKLGFQSIEDMAKQIFEGKIKINKIEGFNPVFRLTPPSGGHKSIKEHYPHGSLGNWGENINDLIIKMI
jgi:large subunit ribosomal protein L30